MCSPCRCRAPASPSFGSPSPRAAAAGRSQAPLVFFGEVDWHKCDVTSISRAPTDGLSVYEHLSDFYWKPGTVFHGNRTFLCGAIARDEEPRGKLCSEIFDKIFYSDLSKESKQRSPDAAAMATAASGQRQPVEAEEAAPTSAAAAAAGADPRVSAQISSLVGPSQKHVYCHAHLITYSAAGKLQDVWHLNPNSVVADFKLEVYKIRALNSLDADDPAAAA